MSIAPHSQGKVGISCLTFYDIVRLRKLTKNRGSFPSDEALSKLSYLALRNISQKWSMPIRDWKAALTRFTIEFGDRISVN